jgi:hypothetical protein
MKNCAKGTARGSLCSPSDRRVTEAEDFNKSQWRLWIINRPEATLCTRLEFRFCSAEFASEPSRMTQHALRNQVALLDANGTYQDVSVAKLVNTFRLSRISQPSIQRTSCVGTGLECNPRQTQYRRRARPHRLWR